MSVLAPQFPNIPAPLRDLPQWVAWRLEKRDGEDKPTKIPYNPLTGGKARAGDASTWGSFDQAASAYQRSLGAASPYTGIGFQLSADDPYLGIDLDHCIDPDTGEVANWASEIVDALPTYWERSPSGTGLRGLAMASLPEGGRNRQGPVEMYDHARYVTITGAVFGAAAPIADCSDILPQLHAKLFPPVPPQAAPMRPAAALSLSDGDLIDKASRSKNGAKFDALWRGDTSAYGGDESAADLALCGMLGFWAQGDAGRIDSLFRQSGLYREKWDRADYRQRTLNEALSGKTEFYSPPGERIAQRGLKAARAAKNGAHPHPDVSPADTTTKDFAHTDIGNGQRLAARHGGDLRFCHAWEKWLIWDGQRWQKDDTGEIDRRAKETAQHIYQEAADCTDTAQQTELAKHALRSQSHARLQSMIALATSEPSVPARVSEWDKKAWLLACNNGTVDLKTGRLQESQRADLGTKRAGTAYDPAAFAPRWEAFLETVLPDPDLRAFFQRAVGYSLTGDVSEQCLFFLYGSGSNGKSTALRAVMDAIGDYALQAAPDLLIAREASGGPNNDVAELQGTRFVATIEVEDGKRMAEGLVKQITGGDRIKARYMRQDYFEFEPTHKIFLAANHKPTIRGQDFAIWRRIKVLPFDVQIADADKDAHLPEKLRAEMPGILAWAVRGCLEWQRLGLAEPQAVKAATAEYQAGEDILADFLGECCLLRPVLRVTAAALYTKYTKWAEENSERALSKKNFGTRLQEGRRIYSATSIGPKKARGWEGIGLIDTESAYAFGPAASEETDKTDKTDPKIPISRESKVSHGVIGKNTSDLSVLSEANENEVLI